jgi:hypothetical protein
VQLATAAGEISSDGDGSGVDLAEAAGVFSSGDVSLAKAAESDVSVQTALRAAEAEFGSDGDDNVEFEAAEAGYVSDDAASAYFEDAEAGFSDAELEAAFTSAASGHKKKKSDSDSDSEAEAYGHLRKGEGGKHRYSSRGHAAESEHRYSEGSKAAYGHAAKGEHRYSEGSKAAYGHARRGEAGYGHTGEARAYGHMSVGEGGPRAYGHARRGEAAYGGMRRPPTPPRTTATGAANFTRTTVARAPPPRTTGPANFARTAAPRVVDFTRAPPGPRSPLHAAYEDLKAAHASSRPDPLRITSAQGRMQEAAQIAGTSAVAQLRADREAAGDTHHPAFALLGQMMEF